MTVSAWRATLGAWATLNDSALDGITQNAMSFGGYRVALFPITD
jgi:hypothetical protein